MASRDLKAKEELCYDYNLSVFGDASAQQCRCGSEKCRSIIGSKGMATRLGLLQAPSKAKGKKMKRRRGKKQGGASRGKALPGSMLLLDGEGEEAEEEELIPGMERVKDGASLPSLHGLRAHWRQAEQDAREWVSGYAGRKPGQPGILRRNMTQMLHGPGSRASKRRDPQDLDTILDRLSTAFP